MIQKDLNLFSVYKKSSPASAGKGYKGIVVMVVLFIFIVGAAYGGLLILKRNLQTSINAIETEMNDPDTKALQKELEAAVRKNELLLQYINSAKSAKSAFDKSRIIDSSVFRSVLDAIPASVSIGSYAVTATDISLVCTSLDFPSTATYAKALADKDIFFSVSYDSVVKGDDGLYRFTLYFHFEKESEPLE